MNETQAALLEALKSCLAMLERADCSTGYCCCGSSVDRHGTGDGHSPVDEGDYHQFNAMDAARAAITSASAQQVGVAAALEQECADIDGLLRGLHLDPDRCRTEGGSLQVQKVLGLLGARAGLDDMVNRFLGWKLPEDFSPDCGITFKRTHSEQGPWGPQRFEPIGTNLLTADQARAMLKHVIGPAAFASPAQQVGVAADSLRSAMERLRKFTPYEVSSIWDECYDDVMGQIDALAASPPPGAPAPEAQPEKVNRNDPLSALAIRLLVAAGHVTQEKANEAFNIACGAMEAEAKRMNVTLPWVTADAPQATIDMVLHCPTCGLQHVDAAEPMIEHEMCSAPEFGSWDNPPHRSHLCHGCGHIWRPADVPTNGVAAVKTTGKADSPIAAPQAQPGVVGPFAAHGVMVAAQPGAPCGYGSVSSCGCYSQTDGLGKTSEFKCATHAAPQAQHKAEPAAWRHNLTHTLHDTEDEVQLADAESWAEPLYLHPPAPTQPVPQGWKLVPVEPTPRMLARADRIIDCDPQWIAKAYRAMLAESPQPEQPGTP